MTPPNALTTPSPARASMPAISNAISTLGVCLCYNTAHSTDHCTILYTRGDPSVPMLCRRERLRHPPCRLHHRTRSRRGGRLSSQAHPLPIPFLRRLATAVKSRSSACSVGGWGCLQSLACSHRVNPTIRRANSCGCATSANSLPATPLSSQRCVPYTTERCGMVC